MAVKEIAICLKAPKEMARLLMKNGFVEVKSNGGSHKKFQNPLTKKTVIVPFHTKDLGKGLQHIILKQAGLK